MSNIRYGEQWNYQQQIISAQEPLTENISIRYSIRLELSCWTSISVVIVSNIRATIKIYDFKYSDSENLNTPFLCKLIEHGFCVFFADVFSSARSYINVTSINKPQLTILRKKIWKILWVHHDADDDNEHRFLMIMMPIYFTIFGGEVIDCYRLPSNEFTCTHTALFQVSHAWLLNFPWTSCEKYAEMKILWW